MNAANNDPTPFANSSDDPSPNFDPSPGPGSDASHSKSSLLVQKAVVLAVALVVIGPMVYRAAPPEIARWYVANAHLKHEQGKPEERDQALEQALKWDAQCPEAGLLRDEIEANGLYDKKDLNAALAICNRALAKFPNDLHMHRLREKIFTALVEIGRFDEKIADCKNRLKLHRRSSSTIRGILLNELAYYRALANKECETGLKEINEALEIQAKNPAMLDTRGFLQYRLGRFQEAIQDLNQSVEEMEAESKTVDDRRKALPETRRDEFDKAVREFNRSFAVILFHRSLIWEKLDEKSKAEADLSRVRELGHEPNHSLY